MKSIFDTVKKPAEKRRQELTPAKPETLERRDPQNPDHSENPADRPHQTRKEQNMGSIFDLLGKPAEKRRQELTLAKLEILERQDSPNPDDSENLAQIADALGDSPAQVVNEGSAVKEAARLRRFICDIGKYEAAAESARQAAATGVPELEKAINELLAKRNALISRAQATDTWRFKARNVQPMLAAIIEKFPIVGLSDLTAPEDIQINYCKELV